jgi:hypothetical protein
LVFTWQKSTDNGATWNTVKTTAPTSYSIASINDNANGIANSSTLSISKTDTSMVDDIYRLNANNPACGDSTVGAPLKLNYVWKGTTSTDWSDATNWYPGT